MRLTCRTLKIVYSKNVLGKSGQMDIWVVAVEVVGRVVNDFLSHILV